jgi:hypothetical protein
MKKEEIEKLEPLVTAIIFAGKLIANAIGDEGESFKGTLQCAEGTRDGKRGGGSG